MGIIFGRSLAETRLLFQKRRDAIANAQVI
jgi:hypothetical protein